MLALLYIGGFIAIGLAVIALFYAISPVLGWVFVALLWFWAFRTPRINDWRWPRLRRKRPRVDSDSQ